MTQVYVEVPPPVPTDDHGVPDILHSNPGGSGWPEDDGTWVIRLYIQGSIPGDIPAEATQIPADEAAARCPWDMPDPENAWDVTPGPAYR